MDVSCSFGFEAAHRLPNVPDGHKCARLHGHSYTVEVTVTGDVDEHLGWVVDFGDIKRKVRPIVGELDHRYLNEVPGLENPTSENVARWMWDRITGGGLRPSAVAVRETCTSHVVYRGPGG